MALADVAKKEHSTIPTTLASLLPSEGHSPITLLSLAAIGPALLMLTVTLASLSKGLPLLSCAIAFFSMILLIKWRMKGLFGALSLVAMGYFGRLIFGAEAYPVWELGFFLSTGIGIYVSHQCFEECIDTYERESLSVTEDFEKLKEVHATYTTEKAGECERLKEQLLQREQVISEYREEISSLKNVVSASSSQASSFAQKNKVLQEKTFELHKEMIELRAKKFPPSINPKMVHELNTLRVNSFQQKKLIEHVLSVVHPLKVDPLSSTGSSSSALVKPYIEEVLETPQVGEVIAPASIVTETETPSPVEALLDEVIAEPLDSVIEEQNEPVTHRESLIPQEVVEAIVDEKAILAEKEKEKARIKKVYYEQLDTCNGLKAAYSKDLSDTEAKKEYDEANQLLKEKKAELVAIEKELFSLKKELRDKGKLFS